MIYECRLEHLLNCVGGSNLKFENLEKITHVFNNNRIKIKKTYLVGPFVNPPRNVFLNTEINNILEDKNQIIAENRDLELSDGNSYPIYFYDTLDADSEIDLFNIGVQRNFKDKQERILMFFNIYCESDKKVFMYKTLNFCKVWIDGKLILHGDNYDGRGEVILPLATGNNQIMIEYNSTCNKGLVFFDISKVEDSLEMECISDYSLRNASDKIDIIQETVVCWAQEQFEMLVIPRDFCNIDERQAIIAKVYDNNKNLIHSFETGFQRIIKVPLEKFLLLNTSYLTIEITYEVDKRILVRSTQVLIKNPQQFIENLCQEYRSLQLNLNIDDHVNFYHRSIDVMQRLGEEINYADDLRELIADIKILEDLLSHYSKGGAFRDYVLQYKGAIQVYYISSIDNSIEKYWLALPHNYSDQCSYSLLYHLPIRRYAQPFVYEVINEMLQNGDEFIFVSPTGRGTTLGSYIGEASFLEVNSLVNDSWNINLGRIYSYGNSNGGFGTWALAQAHPNLFRGILASGGGPYLKNLKNVSHMSIVNVCGTSDQNYYQNFRKINDSIDHDFKDYVSYELDSLNHFDSEVLTFSPLLIRQLLNKKEYSCRSIRFRTERIRHNKTKYVVIDAFSDKADFAEISIDIGKDIISISTNNISQFTLDVSQQNISEFIINSIKYSFAGMNTIIFKYDTLMNRFEMVKQKKYSGYESYGMGIMDIYLERFQILIPNTVDQIERNTLNEVANAFAKPITKTWSPTVYVKYPKYYYEDLDLSHLNSHSLVILPHKIDEEIKYQLTHSIGFDFNEVGYELGGEFHNLKYVLVAITKQKTNPSQKLLFIYYNDVNLLKKSIFARNIILGSYVNGMSKYFNKDIMIFTNKGMNAFNYREEQY